MIKLLVFSDSHGRPRPMLEAIERETGANACFFLGDGAHDPDSVTRAFPSLPLYSVQGNCDLGSPQPEEGLAPFGGVLFFYTHGHLYGVKQNQNALCAAARRRGADVALFGHTHVPSLETRDGLALFNPGSISLPRIGPATYGRVFVQNAVPIFEIVELAR